MLEGARPWSEDGVVRYQTNAYAVRVAGGVGSGGLVVAVVVVVAAAVAVVTRSWSEEELSFDALWDALRCHVGDRRPCISGEGVMGCLI